MQEDVAETELVLVGVTAEVFQPQVVADWKVDSVVGRSVLDSEVQLEAEV